MERWQLDPSNSSLDDKRTCEAVRLGLITSLRRTDAEVEIDDIHSHAQLQSQLRVRILECAQPLVAFHDVQATVVLHRGQEKCPSVSVKLNCLR